MILTALIFCNTFLIIFYHFKTNLSTNLILIVKPYQFSLFQSKISVVKSSIFIQWKSVMFYFKLETFMNWSVDLISENINFQYLL